MGPPPRIEPSPAEHGSNDSGGLWPELWRRRVPYFLGGYVAAIAGIVQFVDWLVGRYALSPTLTDFTLAALLLLLPTVAMLAWRHGQPGRNRWTRVERLGVPINLVTAAGILFAAFGGRSLGATTMTVIVEDEEGNEVEAVVARAEFRRHLALFYFDNETEDAELDWLQYGIPRGLWADWRQDIFMDVREGLSLSPALRENGRPDGLNLPRALKGSIAEKQNVDYFLGGEILWGEDGLTVVTSLYEVGTNRLVAERTHTGQPFDLIDQISLQVRADLEIPARRLSATTDLPLDELLTESETAYRAYVEAFRALAVDSDYPRAAEYAAKAVAEDPSFALGHWIRYAVAILSNEGATAVEAINATMENRYRLPEREQYYVRREYHYLVGQDPEKGLRLAEMSVTINPEDIEARAVLAVLYRAAGRTADEIEQYLEILRFAPSQTQTLLAVGAAYSGIGEYGQALDYLTRYSELAPQDMQAYPQLARAYRATGRFDEAREACENALLLEPQNVTARLCLAGIAYEQADWAEAESQYEDAANVARTAADRGGIHRARASYHIRRGQIEASIRERSAEIALLGPAGNPPVQVLLRRMQTLSRFVLAGRPQAALDSAETLGAEFEAPFDQMSGVGELQIYSELEDAEGLERAIVKVEGVISTLGAEALRSQVVFARARVREIRGDWETALAEYRRAIEMEPAATGWRRGAARCLRKLGRLDEAVAEIDQVFLLSPYAPRTLVELAKIEIERGSPEVAATHLERALAVWSAADRGYAPADEARALLASLAAG